MTDIATGRESAQFLSTLKLVKNEVINALDDATSQLDAYAEQGNVEHLVAFLEAIQQIRGTFKMLDFRAGERLCEELAETGRVLRNQAPTESSLTAFAQAVLYLKRYLEFVDNGDIVAPSLLIPTINQVRRERRDKPLPEAYFFMVNMRPKIAQPQAVLSGNTFPYRRARQLFQLGLLGLIRGNGRKGPVQIMQRAVSRFEIMSRGSSAWLFWYVALGALEGLGQDSFEMTPQRLTLLGYLDRLVRRIQEMESKAFSEKIPDWLLKEFLYLVALAEPETKDISQLQQIFHLQAEVREKELSQARAKLRGPDQSALDSLSEALQDELQSIKDLIDIFERTEISESNFDDLQASLSRIGDTLQIVNLNETSDRTRGLCARIKKLGVAGLSQELAYIADEVMYIEQSMRALSQKGLDKTALVDPVSLKEARISIIAESMTALTLVKRGIASYLDSKYDKLHVRNVSKSLIDVSGAMMFLENEPMYQILRDIETFITKQILESSTVPPAGQMEALADLISAIEYYLDSLNGQTAGAEEALKLAADSIRLLRR